ncbi:MAG: 3D domain-containing protein [Bacillota bacterium]
MKKVKLSVLILLLLILSGFLANKFLKKEITIIDNQKVINVKTFRKDVSSLLENIDINLRKEDKLSVSLEDELKDNMIIKINRAFPVEIIDNGKQKTIYTTKTLVKNVLDKYNITLDDSDKVYPSSNSFVTKNNNIKITRVETKKVVKEEKIPFKTIFKYVSSLDANEIKEKQTGMEGKQKITYKVILENGVETSKKIIDKKLIEKPKDKIVYKGIDKLFVNSRGTPFRYKKVITMESTAYDLSYQSTGKTKEHPSYGITFSGTQAKPGVVAVDPSVIPLGSKLYIESLDNTKDYGFASAEDTGSAIKGNRIDLFISNHNLAMKYGRRNVRVYVLDENVGNDKLEGYSNRWMFGKN